MNVANTLDVEFVSQLTVLTLVGKLLSGNEYRQRRRSPISFFVSCFPLRTISLAFSFFLLGSKVSLLSGQPLS